MKPHPSVSSDTAAGLGRLPDLPRLRLLETATALEPMPNLAAATGRPNLFVKRDDCSGLAFGGNKVRQLEFYLGEARAADADTILITGAVQSNFVRLAAAAARKNGMECHIQLEERVDTDSLHYRTSGNVLIDRLLGATLHSFPLGEDENAADGRLEELAGDLRKAGRRPYVIHLGPDHPPLGALGYVAAAGELLAQIAALDMPVDGIVLASGSGNSHAGLLFGLRALGSGIPLTGICVRRPAAAQAQRIAGHCRRIDELLDIGMPVADGDIRLDDTHFTPGYGHAGDAVMRAIMLGARTEALMLDPTYTGKAFAGFLKEAARNPGSGALIFIHTGGTPGLFAYEDELVDAFDRFDGHNGTEA
jgi:D-cysteine desulfhydrase/L-cysteate sulfo-lyase